MSSSLTQPTRDVDREAVRVLDLLDRWSKRYEEHHAQRRESPRCPVRMSLTIYVGDEQMDLASPESMEGISMPVWTRNVSRHGMGFICRQKINATEIVFCLPKAESPGIWIKARVVRSRIVHEGFHEYGVAFLERTTTE
jgi:hypothetical protein